MHSVFKKLPDLSYRSHKLQTAAVGDSLAYESFDIRPPYLDRGFMDSSKCRAAPTTVSAVYPVTNNVSTAATTLSFGGHNSRSSMATFPSTAESAVTGVTGVTGIPNLVELDDTLNTLDPGQLLRESAAAATRQALMSEPPRISSASGRRSSHLLVDDLLQQIYRHSNRGHCDKNIENESDDDTEPPGARFSPKKCGDPLKRKGNSNPILLSM